MNLCKPVFPNNVIVSRLQFSMLHRYIYLDPSLWTVSMGHDTEAIHHFRNGLRIFERIDCVCLQQQVIHLNIIEYSLIIMVNTRSGAVK